MINPKHKLFRWGPIDAKVIYTDVWMHGLDSTLKNFGIGWPDVLTHLSKGKVLVICDHKNLYDAGEKIFNSQILDTKIFKQNYNLFVKQTKQILAFERIVNNTKKMNSFNEKELLKLFNSWSKAYYLFWTYGYIAELGNWGGEQILTRRLKELKLEDHEILEKLSAPSKLSFFQNEEADFFKVRLIRDTTQQNKALIKHQKKYYWLKNSYNGAIVLDMVYFREELDNVSLMQAKDKLNAIKKYTLGVEKAREGIIKKYKMDNEIANIAEKLAFSIWWQDFRKKYIYIANHVIAQILKQASIIKPVQFEDLEFYTLSEISNLLIGNKEVEIKDIIDRRKAFTLYYHANGRLEYLNSQQSAKVMAPFLNNNVKADVKEFKGIVVSVGKINQKEKSNLEKFTGTVKILFTPKDIHKLQKGEILVAPMTSPDYIFAMRKSSAIITDEGGLTSHAAIVSRELGIPCIVGTGIATKVLKDNDKIMIDIKKGVIKKI